MFDETLTIEQLLRKECRIIVTQKDGKVQLNVETIPENHKQRPTTVVYGRGSLVTSALNNALKFYAQKEGIERITYLHDNRKKDELFSNYLGSDLLVAEEKFGLISVSYFKDLNSEDILNINKRHNFILNNCPKFEKISESFKDSYAQIRNIEIRDRHYCNLNNNFILVKENDNE